MLFAASRFIKVMFLLKMAALCIVKVSIARLDSHKDIFGSSDKIHVGGFGLLLCKVASSISMCLAI